MGEFATNLAFDASHINAIAINNRGPDTATGAPGNFEGGNKAFMVEFIAGAPVLLKRWDWKVALDYRYIESDALVDAFVDSDFGLGGTNLEGYTVSGSLALSSRTWMSVRWLSANSIAGPAYKSDVIQVDFNGRF